VCRKAHHYCAVGGGAVAANAANMAPRRRQSDERRCAALADLPSLRRFAAADTSREVRFPCGAGGVAVTANAVGMAPLERLQRGRKLVVFEVCPRADAPDGDVLLAAAAR
jgi:hypothetical protein